MLPEAESINKDGSQDGLMEAANIPLQSKEEDQMWKILKTDERYYLYLRYNWYGIMIFATFSSIPFMCNWISKNNSRHKYRKWKMEFSSSLTMDLKLNENRALLPKLKVILIWSLRPRLRILTGGSSHKLSPCSTKSFMNFSGEEADTVQWHGSELTWRHSGINWILITPRECSLKIQKERFDHEKEEAWQMAESI